MGNNLIKNIWCFKVRNNSLWGSISLDHLLVMTAALYGRSWADIFAEHSIQMIFSFLENIAIDKLQKPLKELHILPVLLLWPMQRIIFFYLLRPILKRKFAFSWFEEPRLHFLKRGGTRGVLVGTVGVALVGGLGDDLTELVHGV